MEATMFANATSTVVGECAPAACLTYVTAWEEEETQHQQPEAFRRLDSGYDAEQVSDWAEVRVCNRGTGHRALHAAQDISADGSLCVYGFRRILDRPTYLTRQVDAEQHALLTPSHLQYINHSCTPNLHCNTQSFRIEALRPIKAGEELTYFYPSTEWDMEQAFDCQCGAPTCIGRVAGAKHLTPAQRAVYKLNSHITELLAA